MNVFTNPHERIEQLETALETLQAAVNDLIADHSAFIPFGHSGRIGAALGRARACFPLQRDSQHE
jgi:hypothetical protein